MKYYIYENSSVLEKDDNGVYTHVLVNYERLPFNAFDAQSDVMRAVTKEEAAKFLASFGRPIPPSERNLDSRDCGTGSGGSGGGDVGRGRVES